MRLGIGGMLCDGCGGIISQQDYDNGEFIRGNDGNLQGSEDNIFCINCGENWICINCNQVILQAERGNVNFGYGGDVAHVVCPGSDSESDSDVEMEGGKRRKKKTRKYKGNKYPYKNITKKEAIADFIKLKTTTNPRSLNGLEIVNYGTEKLRVRTKYRGKSLIERWKDKKARKTLKKFANRLYKGSYTDSLLHAYRSAIALSWGTLSSMRTSAALQMYRKYNAKKVLDFTAGWGSRMTAALAADIDYIGIDTNKSLKKGYNKIIKTVKKHTKSKVKLFFQPAETVDYSKLDYDFVFTSPPYEYLELYEHMKNYEGTKKIKQAYSANDTKRKNDGFYDTFLIPTIKEIYKHLPKGKWICLNVPDLMYDKIKKKWKACDKKEDYMISKRVGSVMKAADRRGQEFVYCWKKK
jgi:16S rRNA G966 N2-methylase RsmD